MKCPNGKHEPYCPEEDSVSTFEPEFKQECSQCVLEERNKLRSDNASLRGMLRKEHLNAKSTQS